MKWFLALCIALNLFTGQAQTVAPFVDFNGYFKSFQNGFFRQLEFQPIKGFKVGDEFVAYIDTRGNLRVFAGDQPEDLSNMNVEYEVSDHLMTWKIGPTLNLWDAGKKRTLTYFGDKYAVRDSLVVYQHLQTNSVMAYYAGTTYELYTMIGDLPMPTLIGENIVAFKDNGNYYKIFWRGQIYDVGVWHNPIVFSAGTDVVAFNDPINGTFAVFDKGQFIDLENFFARSYKVGRNFVVYENQNGELIHFGNGKSTSLSNFGATMYDVLDDVVIWQENGMTYCFVNNQKVELARFPVKEYKLKNNVIAFRNVMGGVDAIINGERKTLTNQMDAGFTIYGNSVLVELFNRSFLYFRDGREYRN